MRRVDTQRRFVFSKLSGHQHRVMENAFCLIFVTPPSTIHKVQPVHPLVYSKPHKVKGYADDLTIISSIPAEHQEVITMVDDRCMDVGLRMRLGKCYSLLFDGKDAKKVSHH